MKTINKLAILTLSGFIMSSTAAAAQQPVAKLLGVQGKAFVETTDGVRQIATTGMQLAEGSSVILLEKAKVAIHYTTTGCKVSHGQNTLLTVMEAAQCVPGQPIAVGAAAAPAGLAAGAAAVPATVAATAAATTASVAGVTGLSTAGLIAASVAVVGVGAAAANNDNSTTPVSP